jgi:hypothetical protein
MEGGRTWMEGGGTRMKVGRRGTVGDGRWMEEGRKITEWGRIGDNEGRVTGKNEGWYGGRKNSDDVKEKDCDGRGKSDSMKNEGWCGRKKSDRAKRDGGWEKSDVKREEGAGRREEGDGWREEGDGWERRVMVEGGGW